MSLFVSCLIISVKLSSLKYVLRYLIALPVAMAFFTVFLVIGGFVDIQLFVVFLMCVFMSITRKVVPHCCIRACI